MMLTRQHGGIFILLSFAVALVLTIVPLPAELRTLRPDWVGLTLIFWCLALPYRVSVGSGFMAGLLLDSLSGTLLGEHALALSLIAYLCVRLHQRIRVYPIWQQALTVMTFLLLHQLLTLWIDSIIGRPMPPLEYWLPSLIGAVLWPFIFHLLTLLRVNFSVQ
jgi:rod shape-determining protein MreD